MSGTKLPETEYDEADTDADDHLADVDDGCGCVEVWEYLSERRHEAEERERERREAEE